NELVVSHPIQIRVDQKSRSTTLCEVGMRLNTFKCSSLLGALALITLGCTGETTTQPLTTTTGQKAIEPIVAGQIVFYDITTSYGIYIANPDGSRVGRISPQGALDIDPSVSHDGKRIAYSNAFPNGNDWNIYVMNADGTNRVRVTNLTGSNDRPAWSPDGKRIAFESTADHSYNQVYVVNADGTGLTALTV